MIAEHQEMAKPKGRPKSERDDKTAKIDRVVLGRAKMVADIRGITVAEYLTELVRNLVDRDLAKEVEQLKKSENPKR